MTAPLIPDTAVEAYLRAEHAAWQDQAPPAIDDSVTVDSAVQAARAATRVGLAAALPHLLPAAPSGETAPVPATVAWIPLSPLRRELTAYHAAMCNYGLTPRGGEDDEVAYDAMVGAALELATAMSKVSLLPLGAAAVTTPAEAYVQGYASAVYALRDDGRYAHWWSSAGRIPDGPVRRHLADYLETIGPAAWTETTDAAPSTDAMSAEVAAASVPARTNADAPQVLATVARAACGLCGQDAHTLSPSGIPWCAHHREQFQERGHELTGLDDGFGDYLCTCGVRYGMCGTNAQVTPPEVDRIVQALVDDHGWTCRRDLREIVTATLQLAAAPSGVQPTAPTAEQEQAWLETLERETAKYDTQPTPPAEQAPGG